MTNSLYTPLTRPSEFRLLTLQPSNEGGDNIECILSTALLDGNPSYEAISYVWGTEDAQDPITVNKQPFHTTSNLREALILLRDGLEEPLKLWIDAICINQHDHEERNKQVLQMRRIYSCARQTHIMLDNDDVNGAGYSSVVLLLDGIASVYEVMLQSQSAGQQNALEVMVPLLWVMFPRNDIWKAVPLLFRCPWFTRVWTIQEVAVASKVVLQYGRRQIDWSRLQDAVKMLQLVKEYLDSHTSNWISEEGSLEFCVGETNTVLDESQTEDIEIICSVVPTTLIDLRYHVRAHRPMGLLYLLRHAWYHKATDERDKVYALLGLVAEDERPRYRIDYNNSNSVEKAFSTTVKTMLQYDPTMEVLCFAGIHQRTNSDLPSWCPDWRLLDRTLEGKELISREWLSSRFHQWSAGGTEQEPHEVEDWRIIAVSGSMIGVVGLTSSVSNLRETTLTSLDPSVADDAKQSPQYEERDPPDPAIRQLDFDAIVDLVSLGTWAYVTQNNGSFSLGPKDDIQDIGAQPGAGGPALRHDFLNRFAMLLDMMERYDDKQAFVASSDMISTHVGIGPPSVELGDILCLFHGARTPILLRKVEKADRYVFVGACYVRGIMEGQLMADNSAASRLVFYIS